MLGKNHLLIKLKSTKTNREKNIKIPINIDCIYMENTDIQWLHNQVGEGTMVIIQ